MDEKLGFFQDTIENPRETVFLGKTSEECEDFRRNPDCQFFSGDVKVSYADRFFYYPDAFVTGDGRD